MDDPYIICCFIFKIYYLIRPLIIVVANTRSCITRSQMDFIFYHKYIKWIN